jgi:hypothetical protein
MRRKDRENEQDGTKKKENINPISRQSISWRWTKMAEITYSRGIHPSTGDRVGRPDGEATR